MHRDEDVAKRIIACRKTVNKYYISHTIMNRADNVRIIFVCWSFGSLAGFINIIVGAAAAATLGLYTAISAQAHTHASHTPALPPLNSAPRLHPPRPTHDADVIQRHTGRTNEPANSRKYFLKLIQFQYVNIWPRIELKKIIYFWIGILFHTFFVVALFCRSFSIPPFLFSSAKSNYYSTVAY